MDEKRLVVQHNKLIEARYKLTVEEQRVIKTLVSLIQPGDEDFKVYEMRVLDLANLIGLSDDYYYNKIRILTKKLRDSSLTFLNDSGDEIQTGWLSSAIYRKGKGSVELRFDPVLKPYLLQLKHLFTSYELGNVLRLKSIYSIRIYELLKQYQKIGFREFEICSLRQILQVESEYAMYNDLKRYVLIPSGKEISEKTDILCSFSENKKGRRVVGIRFAISPKKIVDQKGRSRSNKIQGINRVNNEELELDCIDSLLNFGVTKATAENIVGEFDQARIKAAISYTKSQIKLRKVKNPGGFIVEAIKNEYRDSQGEELEKKRRAKKAREDKENQDKELEKQKNLENRHAIETYLNSLTKDQFFELEAEFIEVYKNDACVMEKYRKERLKNPTVKGCFGAFILKKLSHFKKGHMNPVTAMPQ